VPTSGRDVQPGSHELVEDQLQLAVGSLPRIDVERREEPLVHQSTQARCAATVRSLGTSGQDDRAVRFAATRRITVTVKIPDAYPVTKVQSAEYFDKQSGSAGIDSSEVLAEQNADGYWCTTWNKLHFGNFYRHEWSSLY